MVKRKTLQTAANTLKSLENYNNNWPYFAKKYVNNRTNSLAEVKRVYVYILGNTKGYTAFENHLKDLQPEAKRTCGKLIEWHFDTEFLWDAFLLHEKMAKIIVARQINNWEELSNRAYTY